MTLGCNGDCEILETGPICPRCFPGYYPNDGKVTIKMPNAEIQKIKKMKPLIGFFCDHKKQLSELEEGIAQDFERVLIRVARIIEAFNGPKLKEGKASEDSPTTALQTLGDYIGNIEAQTERTIASTRQGFNDLNLILGELEELIFEAEKL